MLLQIIAVTPGEHAPGQVTGLHGLLGAPLSDAGAAQAETLRALLKGRPIDTEYACGFVACTRTAQIAASLDDDLDVNRIEDDFESLPFANEYVQARESLGYATLHNYLAYNSGFLSLGRALWQTFHDHVTMIHVHVALVVMPPGLLQATMLNVAPVSDHGLLYATPLGPCQGFEIGFSSKGHVVHASPLAA